MQTFILGPKIYMGECSLDVVFEGCNKVFIVTDKFMEQSGKVKYITNHLYEKHIEFKIFSDIHPDPDFETVMAGLKVMQAMDCDTVVAMGGGSAIDAAKAMRCFYEKAIDENALRCTLNFIIIPTTSGTGSEVSNYAVITESTSKMKHSIVDDRLLADAAILDANLVVSAPAKITAETGVDALVHALESLVATNRTDFTDAFAEKAARLIFENLLEVYKNPTNIEARQKMHDASTMAGVAFSNAGLGLVHAMSHALGARFHLPHGRSNAILLPYVMHYNAGCGGSLTPVAERYAEIAKFLGLDKTGTRQGALSLIRAIRTLIDRVGLPNSIKSDGIDKDTFEAAVEDMAIAAMNDATIVTNPKPCTKEDIISVYMSAYNGVY